MVVEDEQIVASDLETKLTKLGYEVVGIAASADEALAIAERHRPEVILMDIRLQGPVSGIDIAGPLQRLTGAPVIFVTAYAGVFLRSPEQMRPPGICLSKPFSNHELRAALEAIVKAPGT
jgi:CheY-like chemotaxis protein